MKLGILANQHFQTSFSRLLKEKLPVKTAFKLRGFAKIVAEQTAKYEELRDQYLREYGEKDENGNLKTHAVGKQEAIVLQKDRANEYNSKMIELNMLDIEFPEIKLSELGDESALTLLPEDFVMLDFIVE